MKKRTMYLPFTKIVISKNFEGMTYKERLGFYYRYFPSCYFFGIIDFSFQISIYFSKAFRFPQ